MEHWQIYAAAIATVIGVLGVSKAMCDKSHKEIQTVWKRFDEYKQHLENTHVSKEVCGILHNQIIEDICEIKADVKKLLLLQKNNNGNS